MAKYALKIRKTDLPLLAMLNGGVEPLVTRKSMFLVIDTDPEGSNSIVSENELAQIYDINANAPTLHKLKAERKR